MKSLLMPLLAVSIPLTLARTFGGPALAEVQAPLGPSAQKPALLAEPPVVAGCAGKLTVELTAAPGRFSIGAESFDGMLYGRAC